VLAVGCSVVARSGGSVRLDTEEEAWVCERAQDMLFSSAKA
jgi:hypothetical protein